MTTLRGPGLKSVGKPDAGNRHVRFDERGRETGLLTPRPSSTLPIFEVQPEENKPASRPPDEPISSPQPNLEPLANSVAQGRDPAETPLAPPAHRDDSLMGQAVPPVTAGCSRRMACGAGSSDCPKLENGSA
jgi:hypothetical protein